MLQAAELILTRSSEMIPQGAQTLENIHTSAVNVELSYVTI